MGLQQPKMQWEIGVTSVGMSVGRGGSRCSCTRLAHSENGVDCQCLPYMLQHAMRVHSFNATRTAVCGRGRTAARPVDATAPPSGSTVAGRGERILQPPWPRSCCVPQGCGRSRTERRIHQEGRINLQRRPSSRLATHPLRPTSAQRVMSKQNYSCCCCSQARNSSSSSKRQRRRTMRGRPSAHKPWRNSSWGTAGTAPCC